MESPNLAQRYFIKVIYQGNHYQGWQKQPHGKTIEDTLTQSLAQIYKKTPLTGSGRTDSGVHAQGQIAHLDLPPSLSTSRLLQGWNAVLPKDIAITEIKKVTPQAHARFDATKRRYAYHLHTTPNPFRIQTSHYYPYPIDLKALNQMTPLLLGKQDCTSFCKTHSLKADNICTIYDAHWTQKEDTFTFHITANRFLHHMVRTIVGTLLNLTQHHKKPKALQEIIDAQNRKNAGPNIPPTGLHLMEVSYPAHLFL